MKKEWLERSDKSDLLVQFVVTRIELEVALEEFLKDRTGLILHLVVSTKGDVDNTNIAELFVDTDRELTDGVKLILTEYGYEFGSISASDQLFEDFFKGEWDGKFNGNGEIEILMPYDKRPNANWIHYLDYIRNGTDKYNSRPKGAHWNYTGGPSVDALEKLAQEFANENGISVKEAAGLFFATLIDRLS